ncbi:hypothetical protein M1446_00790 [Candidatus Dependentiae bacterium]|nr:hypothetical protein [Candidatus Dependentiae bacterium]
MKFNLRYLLLGIFLLISNIVAMAPAEESYIPNATYFVRIQRHLSDNSCLRGPYAYWHEPTYGYKGGISITGTITDCFKYPELFTQEMRNALFKDQNLTFVSFLDANKKVLSTLKIISKPSTFNFTQFDDAVVKLLDPNSKVKIIKAEIRLASSGYPKIWAINFYDKYNDPLLGKWQIQEKSSYETLTGKKFVEMVDRLKEYFDISGIDSEAVKAEFNSWRLSFTDEDLKALNELIEGSRKEVPTPGISADLQAAIKRLQEGLKAMVTVVEKVK